MRRYLGLFLVFEWVMTAWGQTKNAPGIELPIRKAGAVIVLDGVLDEEAWKAASVAKDFFQNYPVDSISPTFQSEARLTFDDHFLYVSFVCYDDSKPDIMQSLRRDFDWDLNDNIGMYLDPYNDFTNGFYFTITPFNVQSEGILSGGAQDDDGFNNSWDNKWYSEVKRSPDRWVAELAIPLKSFRYNHNSDTWNITFVRQDLKRNQVSSWVATPFQFVPASFAYSGRLKFETRPPHAGANVSLIPYLAGISSRDVEKEAPSNNTVNVGMDAKVGLTPSLNLDLTVNPDFSNVEVDQQVINLTRFEFQFPERRQFFLENSDLFSTPGFPDTRPFFSRRIGLTLDSTGTARQVPIQYGARISGKIGKDWRIGLLNMRTQEKSSIGLPAQSYSMAIVQKQVFSRSNIDFFIVDKQSIGLGDYDSKRKYAPGLTRTIIQGTDTTTRLNHYNQVMGFDFNLITKTNRWSGDIYYHRSMDDFNKDKNYSAGMFIGYNTRYVSVFLAQNAVGKNYNAETGYVPALAVYPGYLSSFARVQGTLYPTNSSIAIMAPAVEANVTVIPDGTVTDRTFSAEYNINFLNTASVGVSSTHIFQRLPEAFNPLFPRGNLSYQTGREFEWTEFQLQYNSNTRKIFNFSSQITGGQFYTGTRLSAGGTASVRYQPYGSLSVTVDYNDLQLGQPYGNAQFLLIRPRLDLTLSTKLFLTTVWQYNTRFESVNFNTRLQWRFKPASDIFLVYSHVQNRLPTDFRANDQVLVLKFTYWLNL
ncbi:MAG: carbohydrate binding family 9 domain-containing protein [Cyclobacteriaceae bacterium]|nr:carbohydrate binding family 9 domain-containing protein [Cyclobacteriaceae bacterium]